ncbi:MAG: DUF1636 domain-containing protein [Rhodobacteraceae bacterium]|nr:DUF1636 domain-containing protein [Paracoccaceae bacterium]
MTTITVCDTCNFSTDQKLLDGKTGGEILAEHVEALAEAGITVRRQSCLMGCDRHCNIAIQGAGKLSYVLGKFTPDAGAAQAIIDYAKAYAASETGQVPFKQWPQGVKGHFVARIPPLG